MPGLPLDTDWTLAVRDRSLFEVEQVSTLLAFKAIVNVNDGGTWYLETASDSRAATAMTAGHGIVLRYRGEVVLSGQITETAEQDGPDGPVLAVSGIDDTEILGDKWASPVPGAVVIADYATAGSDDVVGMPAESALHYYVNRNAGNATIPTRRFLFGGGLTMGADGARGSAVSHKARFDPLIPLLQDLALRGGLLVFRVVQRPPVGPNGSVEFQTRVAADRRDTVVFSAADGNLIGFTLTRRAPNVTHVLAAGPGEGTSQVLAEQSDQDGINQWGRRIEQFKKGGGITAGGDGPSLDSQALDELRRGAATVDVAYTTAPGPQYPTDYEVGDLVSVASPRGDVVTGIVTRVTLTATANGGMLAVPEIGPLALSPRARADSRRTGRQVDFLARAAESFTGSMAVFWMGTVASIPSGWELCDGTGSTTDYRGYYLACASDPANPPGGGRPNYAQGDIVGANTRDLGHTHSYAHTHHADGLAEQTAAGMTSNATTTGGAGTHGDTVAIHTHDVQTDTVTQSVDVSGSGGSATQDMRPLTRAVLLIQRVA